MLDVLCNAARRRRDPMGLTPDLMSMRSSRRVLTRLGSSGGLEVMVWRVGVSSSEWRVDVAKERLIILQLKFLQR